MQVILSRDILPTVRHRIGETLPGVKSAHLAEALASALGYRTNAALLSWLASVPFSQLAALDLDIDKATDRLAELGYSVDAEEAVRDGFLRAGARVTGPSYAAQAREAVKAYKANGWEWLTNPQRFAYSASLMHWRMGQSWEGIADFVNNYADAGYRDLHLRLAACLQAKRDFDREIADFLVEFLVEADAEHPFDEPAQERIAWGDQIYWGFQPRIEALFDAVCQTWPVDVDPLALEPEPQLIKRLGRPAILVEGRSSQDHEVGFADTGFDTVTADALAGACCLAKLKSGESKELIGEFALKARNARQQIVDVCLSQVAFVSAGGMSAAKARVAALMGAAAADKAGCA